MRKRIVYLALLVILIFSAGAIFFPDQISTATTTTTVLPFTLYLPVISKIDPPRWLGPDGGSIVCLGISASNPNTMYAGTWGAGVFKTTDGGASWSPVNKGLPGLQINAIAVDPSNPNVVYAGPYRQKLYKTVDGGGSWLPVSSGLQSEAIVYGIAVDPVDTRLVYISTRGISNNGSPPWNGVVYKSSNGGASWKPVLANVGGTDAQDWAYDIAVHPNSPNLVFLAMHEYGVYRSFDYGESFKPSQDGLVLEPDPPHDGLTGRTIVFNPLDSSILYYGVWHTYGTFKSTNTGAFWQLANNGSSGKKIYKIAINPQSPNTLYLATWNEVPGSRPGVLKTINGGLEWLQKGLALINLYTVAVNPQTPSTVFAGTDGDGLYRSTNGGSSWGHRQRGISNASVNAILVHPSPTYAVYTSYLGGGVSRLPEGAADWQGFNSGLPEKNINGLVSNPANPDLLYALTSTSGLYWVNTSVASPSWTRLDQAGLPLTAAIAPVFSPDHPFASREDMEAETESYPQAVPDTSLPQAPMGTVSLLSLAFAPSNTSIAYLGTAGNGLYATNDGGIHWNSKNLSSATVTSIVVSPQNPSQLYAATSTQGVVYYSNNGGTSYTPVTLPSSGTVYSLAISPLDPTRVYAGTANGVYVGVNGSTSDWVHSGLVGVQVTTLAIRPDSASILVAGTTAGVYVSANYGQGWAEVVPELDLYTVRSLAFDPENLHLVYFGTTTSGIVNAFVP